MCDTVVLRSASGEDGFRSLLLTADVGGIILRHLSLFSNFRVRSGKIQVSYQFVC